MRAFLNTSMSAEQQVKHLNLSGQKDILKEKDGVVLLKAIVTSVSYANLAYMQFLVESQNFV